VPRVSKKCCVDCFNSETLKRYIKENGTRGDCNYCESENVFCIEPEELQELFLYVINLYDILEDFMPLDDLKSDIYQDTIYDKLDSEWDVFPYYGDHCDQRDLEERILNDIFPENDHDGTYYPFLHSFVEDQDEYWGITRSSVVLVKRWEEFCNEIKNNHRYFPKTTVNLSIVKNLLHYLNEKINKGTIVYRARISHSGKRIIPSKMGKPPAGKSEAGRANHKGISYLYISSSTNTALAEVRPAIMDRVTVGKFRLTNDLKLVDLRRKIIGDPFRYEDRLGQVVDYLLFMHKLGEELSRTISPRESEIEYLPTQYLSEYIKGLGYDGIIYGSSMTKNEDEFNAVIFNEEKLRCVSTKLYEVYEISHKSRNIPPR